MSAARRVLKWNVPVDGKSHAVGSGSIVLVACQDGPYSVQVWTDERPGEPWVTRHVEVFGTGHPVPEFAIHLGSVVAVYGTASLVWHVFEVPS